MSAKGRLSLWPALGLVLAIVIALQVWWSGTPAIYHLGGWRPPLGIALRADGVSSVMLVMSAAVFCGISLFATTGRDRNSSFPPTYWMLSLCVASGLNLAFLAEDLFTLYVALELLTFAAVPLVCLDGKAAQLEAALTYLLFALLGSLLYLLGAVLIYGSTGTLDIGLAAKTGCGLVGDRYRPGADVRRPRREGGAFPALSVVAARPCWRTAGRQRAVVFPCHQGADLSAPARLAGVGARGPRRAGGAGPGHSRDRRDPVSAGCGRWPSRVSSFSSPIRPQPRSATSFLMLPLVKSSGQLSMPEALAWTGGFLHLVAHAFSKAAMFIAAGVIAEALGPRPDIGLSAGRRRRFRSASRPSRSAGCR